MSAVSTPTPHLARRTVSAIAAGLTYRRSRIAGGGPAGGLRPDRDWSRAEGGLHRTGPNLRRRSGNGETEESYFARTSRHLPGLSSAAAVDGSWWYGAAPVTGADPASGETDDAYFARTGRHLPTP